jgi:hypothetical protein
MSEVSSVAFSVRGPISPNGCAACSEGGVVVKPLTAEEKEEED